MNIIEASVIKIKEERGTPSEYPLFSLVSSFNANTFLGNQGSEIEEDPVIVSHERQIRKHIVTRIKNRILKTEYKFKRLNLDNNAKDYFSIKEDGKELNIIRHSNKGYKLLENNSEGIRIRSFNNSDSFRINTDCRKRLSRRVLT